MRGAQLRPIVLAAGGTAGHLFPAQALASVLRGRGERVVLMTDARSCAAFEGCEVHVIPGAGVAGRGPLRKLSGLAAIGRGVVAARAVLGPLRPAAVVGFGGYPSVAPVLAARSLRDQPVLILHDQNAHLGQANRFLRRFVDHVATSFAHTAGLRNGQGELTGNPVRPAIAALVNAAYTLPQQKIEMLVLGGSLGATIFATLIPAALALLPAQMRARIALTMQCPASVMEPARAGLAACGIEATIAPFFEDVAEKMAAAHLVIARAGGSTVAELAVIGRPAVLIPLTINQDQRANAQALAAAGAAVQVEQSAGPAALARVLQTLLAEPARLARMAAARAGIADAAERLATLVQRTAARAELP